MIFGPFVVDYRSDEFTSEEQTLLHSYKFTDLKRFEFLVSLATSTGSMSTTLRQLSISWFDRGLYPEKKQLEDARSKLARYCGRSIESVLDEITQRKPITKQSDPGLLKSGEIPAAEPKKGNRRRSFRK